MTVPFPDKLRIRRCDPCRDETDFFVSVFPGAEATLYARANATPLFDALAIPEVAALVGAAKAIGIAASGVQRRGKTQDDWNRLRAARVMLDAALRKIEEGRG